MTQPAFPKTPAFSELKAISEALRLRPIHLNQLFAQDSQRFKRMSLQVAGVFLDYSKNLVDDSVMATLFRLARQSNVEARRDAMFRGDHINVTENRAVLHTALRAPENTSLLVDGLDVNVEVHSVLKRIEKFATAIHSGAWRGANGKAITDVVNIGIGGSDLGPKMVTHALRSFAKPGISSHFVSNVDGHDLDAVLAKVDPATTLFVVASKTFTTAETMLNANSARHWFLKHFQKSDLPKHFVAVSSNVPAVQDFGIAPENCFEFWDWVGGRYSLWSAIGLPIVLAVGYQNFRELLAGAYEMDQHFCCAPMEANLPVILALIGIWNRNFLNHPTISIAPYHHDLVDFPSYLQQLDMESNGKSVDSSGHWLSEVTGPVLWGNVGTNAQHAYFQLLHQGTDVVPIDFIAALTPNHALDQHHTVLLANCFAQSQAMMRGKSAHEVAAEMQTAGLDAKAIQKLTSHRTFTGNRPSNTILLERLTPHTLGALIALYEHKVAVQGFCWDINSFDQWGVELGKSLAKAIEKDLKSGASAANYDSSTAGLIDLARVSAKATR